MFFVGMCHIKTSSTNDELTLLLLTLSFITAANEPVTVHDCHGRTRPQHLRLIHTEIGSVGNLITHKSLPKTSDSQAHSKSMFPEQNQPTIRRNASVLSLDHLNHGSCIQQDASNFTLHVQSSSINFDLRRSKSSTTNPPMP